MLCLLTKNNARLLPQFFKAMEQLDYPKEKLRWVWMYGKSIDFTLKLILEFHAKHPEYKYQVYEEPPIERPIRSSLCNALLYEEFKSLWRGEPFILFLDTEIEEIPPNALKKLIKADKDIIAPYIYLSKSNLFYSSYLFYLDGQRFDLIFKDGHRHTIADPPFKYEKEPVELDSVGTMVLIKSEAFLETQWANPIPFYQFCKNAKAKGLKVWAMPCIKVYHSRIEDSRYLLEWYVAKGVLPETELSKIGFKKRNGKWTLGKEREMFGLGGEKQEMFEKKFEEIMK